MPKVIFVQHDGEKKSLEVENGLSIMRAAIDNSVPGIDGDCGGVCKCATCHVYVDQAWMAKVGEPAGTEEAIMSLNPERQENSRLGCQIKMTDELDGIVINLPEFQF